MSILNVVQPDELDPSGFSLIDGKLKVAISSLEDNILQYKNDGLYASAGSDGVLEHYVYVTDESGYVQHKGINFDIHLVDGSLSGQIYGIDSANGLSPDDMIFYNGVTEYATSDDSKYLLQLPRALEDLQRLVLKMIRNDETVFWVVRVIKQPNASENQNVSATVIIDEMINTGGSLPDDGVVVEPEMKQARGLFKFGDGLATLTMDENNGMSLFKVDYDGVIDSSVNLLPEDYRKTVGHFLVVSQLYNVAIWNSPENRIIFAEFTDDGVNFTDIGDSTTSIKSMTVTKDVNGNYLIRREGFGYNYVPTVIMLAADGTVSNYEYPNLQINDYYLQGTTLLGDKLLVFEKSIDYGKQIRVVNALTGDVLTQSKFDYGDRFDNTVFQIVDNDTLVIIDRGNTNQKLNVSLVKVTNSEVSLIKKTTLDFYDRYAPNGTSSGDMTFALGDNTVSYRVAVREDVGYYVKITASATDFQVQEQEITPNLVEMSGDLVSEDVTSLPIITLINGNTGYIQHDLKLSSLNTFSLDMVEHDNSPKPVAFTATWKRDNGHILLNGQIANTYAEGWTYYRLEVDTPSGETHSTKRRTGSAVNGVFTTSLWVIAEPGEYVFRVSHWDGGPVMEARASVPNDDGLDFTPPTVTPDGDGSWILSTTNAGAAGRGYKIYRSRDPISIIDEYYNGSRYITDVAENDPGHFTIPASDRNGIWYIMVGQIGTGGIWTPTFLTYGE